MGLLQFASNTVNIVLLLTVQEQHLLPGQNMSWQVYLVPLLAAEWEALC